MFRIIAPSEFVTSAWKNGGGVTHEIARDLANDPWHWRLSLAEVATDGPFSAFAGYARILTVIEGAGIDLLSPDGTLAARALRPVTFSGDLSITSRMVSGPIRDLNVIFDAAHIAAGVRVVTGPKAWHEGSDLAGLLCLTGEIAVAGTRLATGAFALGQLEEITVAAGATAILVKLTPAQTEATRPATA